jgi:hypothetical protein
MMLGVAQCWPRRSSVVAQGTSPLRRPLAFGPNEEDVRVASAGPAG